MGVLRLTFIASVPNIISCISPCAASACAHGEAGAQFCQITPRCPLAHAIRARVLLESPRQWPMRASRAVPMGRVRPREARCAQGVLGAARQLCRDQERREAAARLDALMTTASWMPPRPLSIARKRQQAA